MTSKAQSLIIELDTALSRSPAAWRGKILRRLTDLFLINPASYSQDQVAVFDDVISHLIEKSDRRMLVELSNRLAQVENAPLKVIGTLARHTDMLVAGPLLEKSRMLTEADLIEIADKERRDPVLWSTIAAREGLSEAVTDILIRRGNAAVARKIIDRPDAPISEASFARMVTSVEKDKDLAAAIAKRSDLPAELRPWLDAALAE
ncbi:MAG TPA: DUF2336 domain-containing protein [Xanthobacteraceae bacterium]|jgi:uncharacterized protein (DUF2336 family)